MKLLTLLAVLFISVSCSSAGKDIYAHTCKVVGNLEDRDICKGKQVIIQWD